MKLQDILAISGKPGLYKIEANRDNGIIASSLGDNKKVFFSTRQHVFTPLENITVYTNSDSIELSAIYAEMKKDEKSIVKANSSAKEIRDYFTKIVPDHDQEKVYTSDIKKIIKWYSILDEKGLLVVEKAKKASSKTEEKKEKKVTKAKTTKKAAPKNTRKSTAKSQNVRKVEKRGSQRGK